MFGQSKNLWNTNIQGQVNILLSCSQVGVDDPKSLMNKYETLKKYYFLKVSYCYNSIVAMFNDVGKTHARKF